MIVRGEAPELAVLMVMPPPSPDRALYLDQLAKNCRLAVVYCLYGIGSSEERGWGEFALDHVHELAESPVDAVRRIARFFAGGNRPDAMVCHGYRQLPYAFALTMARIHRVPTFVRSDTNGYATASDRPVVRAARFALLRTLVPRRTTAWTVGRANDTFWANEGGLRDRELIPFVPAALGRRPSGRRRDPNSPLHLLYVGRLVGLKRVDDLLAAVSRLPETITWSLTIVGTGPDEPRLRRLAGTDRRIRFAGAVSHEDLGYVYESHHALVLPSEFESWGLVVSEARAFGLFVIVSDAVGARYDLVAATNGFVFPVGDIDALRKGILAAAGRATEFVPVDDQPKTTSDLMLASIYRRVNERS